MTSRLEILAVPGIPMIRAGDDLPAIIADRMARAGQKLRALFVDGEDNFIAGENDMIRNRYRVVRIGTTSAEVEDTTSGSKQTIRIIDRSDP